MPRSPSFVFNLASTEYIPAMMTLGGWQMKTGTSNTAGPEDTISPRPPALVVVCMLHDPSGVVLLGNHCYAKPP